MYEIEGAPKLRLGPPLCILTFYTTYAMMKI